MDEVGNRTALNSLLEVRNWLSLGLLHFNECSPAVIATQLLENVVEECLASIALKSVGGKSLEVLDGRVLEPSDLLLISKGRSCLEEQADILAVDLAGLDHDLETHHHLEGNLVRFEQTSVDVSVHFVGQCLNNVIDALLDTL